MADVGAIGGHPGSFLNCYMGKSGGFLTADGNRTLYADNVFQFRWTMDYYNTGTISGTVVDVSNNPLSGYAVCLYYSNNLLMSTTITDANGYYEFTHLEGVLSRYSVRCSDPSNTYNSKVHNNITPYTP